jgi:hypothetical protein
MRTRELGGAPLSEQAAIRRHIQRAGIAYVGMAVIVNNGDSRQVEHAIYASYCIGAA